MSRIICELSEAKSALAEMSRIICELSEAKSAPAESGGIICELGEAKSATDLTVLVLPHQYFPSGIHEYYPVRSS